ncbi:MAG: regulatory protein RecX [Actinomycetota bacterium]
MSGPRRGSRSRAPRSQEDSEGPVQPRGTAKDRALRLLGARDRSRRELERRLAMAGFEAEDIAPALDQLTEAGLIDDERFAAQVVEHAQRGRLAGRRAVMSSLLSKGVSRSMAERAAEGLSSTEEQRAEALAGRQVARLRSLEPAVAFRRLSSLLVRRGFDPGMAFSVARRALGEAPDDA